MAAGETVRRARRRGLPRAPQAWLALGALLVPGALAACGGPSPETGADGAVQRMLDARSRAVRGHDEAAFLATVDPAARTYRTGQRAVFRRLTRLPLADWQYRLTDTGAFPLPDGQGGGARLAAKVELRYRLAGYDASPVVATQYLTLVRRGGSWRVASDTDGDSSGKWSTRQLWDEGPISLVRGRRSLVIGPADDRDRLRELADRTDRAVPAVAGAWPGPWERRVVVEAPDSVRDMAGLLGSGDPAGYTGIAAVTTGEAGGTTRIPADRVIVNPDAYDELSDQGRSVVLTHETTHVATRADTTSDTPLWLSEGFADWVAYRHTKDAPRQDAPELSAAAASHRLPDRLPTNDDFGFTRQADRLAQAYEGSWLACRMIADRWGDRRLARLYTAAGRDADTGSVLQSQLHLSAAAFTREWRSYLSRRLRPGH